MTVSLELHRAEAHRAFIGPEFGAGPDGLDPQALSPAAILADEKLARLGQSVYAELRAQFQEQAEDVIEEESPEDEAYRLKLENMADLLEILLEETLAELENIGFARSGRAPEML